MVILLFVGMFIGEVEHEYPPTMPENAIDDVTLCNNDDVPSTSLATGPSIEKVAQNTSESQISVNNEYVDNSILDQNLLEILGEDPSSKPEFGKEIHKDVATRLEHIATSGLGKEVRKELLDKYLTPSNCTRIGAPLMNPEIKAAIPELTQKRDKGIELRQRQLTSAITCLGQIITNMMQTKYANNDHLKQIMDATRILCDLQYSDSMKRRYFAFSTLKKDINEHLMQTKIDKYLFGENLAETIKAAKAVSKSGAEIKNNTQTAKNTKKQTQPQPSTSRNLNWRAPPAARRQQAPPPPPGTQQRNRPHAHAHKRESSSRPWRYQSKRGRGGISPNEPATIRSARSVSHTITSLEMPRWADPRRDAELRCSYERHESDPPLHSVKWYRDTDEIFRYTPQELETRAFNSSGISIVNSSCDARACSIVVRPERGTAKYTCEVSSEGPRFAVDRRSANMTLAVLPEYEPLITRLPTMVQVGEDALINCTSDYSLPAATIEWFVDNEPQEDPLVVSKNHISGADGDGLQASWRTLHVYPDDYVTNRGYLSLRCQATVDTSPQHVTSMSVRLFVAARPHISSYMFSKNNAAGASSSCIHRFKSKMLTWTVLLLVRTQVPSLVNS